jgi:hypothetical protein
MRPGVLEIGTVLSASRSQILIERSSVEVTAGSTPLRTRGLVGGKVAIDVGPKTILDGLPAPGLLRGHTIVAGGALYGSTLVAAYIGFVSDAQLEAARQRLAAENEEFPVAPKRPATRMQIVKSPLSRPSVGNTASTTMSFVRKFRFPGGSVPFPAGSVSLGPCLVLSATPRIEYGAGAEENFPFQLNVSAPYGLTVGTPTTATVWATPLDAPEGAYTYRADFGFAIEMDFTLTIDCFGTYFKFEYAPVSFDYNLLNQTSDAGPEGDHTIQVRSSDCPTIGIRVPGTHFEFGLDICLLDVLVADGPSASLTAAGQSLGSIALTSTGQSVAVTPFANPTSFQFGFGPTSYGVVSAYVLTGRLSFLQQPITGQYVVSLPHAGYGGYLSPSMARVDLSLPASIPIATFTDNTPGERIVPQDSGSEYRCYPDWGGQQVETAIVVAAPTAKTILTKFSIHWGGDAAMGNFPGVIDATEMYTAGPVATVNGYQGEVDGAGSYIVAFESTNLSKGLAPPASDSYSVHMPNGPIGYLAMTSRRNGVTLDGTLLEAFKICLLVPGL